MDMVVHRNSPLKKPLSLLVKLFFLLLIADCSNVGTTKPFLVSGKAAFDSLPKRKIVLHFWSSWCRLCLSELRAIDSLNQFADQNSISIVTVAVNDSLKAAMNIHTTKLPNSTVIFDDGSLEKIFKVPAVPFTVALDEERNVIPIPIYPSGKFVTGIDGAQPWGSSWGEKIILAVAKH